MIKTEIITINKKRFKKTYSDIGMMIERDGHYYSEAIDLEEFKDRIYTETDIKIQDIEK